MNNSMFVYSCMRVLLRVQSFVSTSIFTYPLPQEKTTARAFFAVGGLGVKKLYVPVTRKVITTNGNFL